MGRTYVQAGSATHTHPGFWMDDGLLELWLRLLALNLEEPSPGDDDRNVLLRRLRDQWLMASRGGWTGCVPHALEEFTESSVGMEIVKSAVAAVSEALDRSSHDFPLGALNLMGWSDGHWTRDIENWRLRDIAHSFRDLLDGRFDPMSSDHMPGSGERPV